MSEKNQGNVARMTRRNFVTGAALAGAAVVGAGMTGCAPKGASETVEAKADVAADAPAWLGQEPEIADADIVKTEETDFLIIGAGTAGLCAAGTAADAGMKFIVAEKNDKVPETREYWGIVNSKPALAQGGEVDGMKLLNELTRYASGKCNQGLIKMWIDESAEVFDWVDAMMAA